MRLCIMSMSRKAYGSEVEDIEDNKEEREKGLDVAISDSRSIF